jgi:hypothetical protein
MFSSKKVRFYLSIVIVLLVTFSGSGVFSQALNNIDDLYKNSFYVFYEMRDPSTWLFWDGLGINGGSNKSLYATNAMGVGLIAFCIGDAQGWGSELGVNLIDLIGQSVWALDLMKMCDIPSSSSDPQLNQIVNDCYMYHRYYNSNGKADPADVSAYEYSTQDNAVLAMGLIFSRNYISDRYSDRQNLIDMIQELLDDMDFTTIISSGQLYMVLKDDGSPDGHPTTPFNEYMMTAYMAKFLHPISDTSHPVNVYWKDYYEDPLTYDSKRIIIKNYPASSSEPLFTDNSSDPGSDRTKYRFLSSFTYQFCYYMCPYFQQHNDYMVKLKAALNADRHFWTTIPDIQGDWVLFPGRPAVYDWGTGAGEYRRWACVNPPTCDAWDYEDWYMANTIHDDFLNGDPLRADDANHEVFVSPHIIGGFIPVQDCSDECIRDLNSMISLKSTDTQNAISIFGSQDREILWRYTIHEFYAYMAPTDIPPDLSFWYPKYVQAFDYATMLFGLASLNTNLGRDFFSKYHILNFIPGDNVAEGKTVNASLDLDKDKVVDGNMYQGWSSNADHSEYISIDLGQVMLVDRVNIFWDEAYGMKYKIYVSTEASFSTNLANWTEVIDIPSGNGALDTLHFDPIQARHVMMAGTESSDASQGYSIWEMQVFGEELPYNSYVLNADDCNMSASNVMIKKWGGIDHLYFNKTITNPKAVFDIVLPHSDDYMVSAQIFNEAPNSETGIECTLGSNTFHIDEIARDEWFTSGGQPVYPCYKNVSLIYYNFPASSTNFTLSLDPIGGDMYIKQIVIQKAPVIDENERFIIPESGAMVEAEWVKSDHTKNVTLIGNSRIAMEFDRNQLESYLEYDFKIETAGHYKIDIEMSNHLDNDYAGWIVSYSDGSWSENLKYSDTDENGIVKYHRWGFARNNLQAANYTLRIESKNDHGFFKIDKLHFVKSPTEFVDPHIVIVPIPFPKTIATTNSIPSIPVDEVFTITANATDADGTIQRVEFYVGSTKLEEDTSAPYTAEWTPSEIGEYEISVKAIDNDNLTAYDTKVVTVEDQFELQIEAEDYDYMSGVKVENCSEGGQNVGWINTGDWMSFEVNIPESGTYTVEYRVASPYSNRKLRLDRDAGSIIIDNNVEIPNTGGWQNWTTVTNTIELSSGQYYLGINAIYGGWNINYFKITKGVSKFVQEDEKTKAGFIPTAFDLNQNYPNPFNPVTTIQYNLPEQSFVTLKVYNIRGEEVTTLVETEKQAGQYRVTFDASELNSGVYFYSLKAGTYKNVKRMILIK